MKSILRKRQFPIYMVNGVIQWVLPISLHKPFTFCSLISQECTGLPLTGKPAQGWFRITRCRMEIGIRLWPSYSLRLLIEVLHFSSTISSGLAFIIMLLASWLQGDCCSLCYHIKIQGREKLLEETGFLLKEFYNFI